ncbi:MAG: hypothetical protein IKQ61_01200 [Spirochaetales bacterium]|nr:hypothetical protein [Spirochaetales bacterium]
MKAVYKLLIGITVSLIGLSVSAQDMPEIQLPSLSLEVEDKHQIVTDILIKDISLPDIKFDSIDKPDFTDIIKVDLEETLPAISAGEDRGHPIDAVIKFGYGLNNNVLADFSLFVKNINPNISVRYLREARESMFIDKPDETFSSSLDDLQTQILYNTSRFSLGSEVGFYQKNYSLQNNSAYERLNKKALNVDIGPSLKFNNNNDLTFRMFNSFLFFNAQGRTDETLRRADFAYLMQTDVVYSQVLAGQHFLTTHAGYDFTIDEAKITGSTSPDLSSDTADIFFNNIKTGINYSTLLFDCFLIKASAEFLGTFRDATFYWYIVPNVKLGYNFRDYFSCYVEGGANLIKRPDQYWYKSNDYVVYHSDAVPGYKWYVKTGIRGAATGWFSQYTDFEFAYNMGGLDWTLTNKSEHLYSVTKRDWTEINIGAGIVFSVKQYLEITAEWKHYFWQKSFFAASDNVTAEIRAMIPKAGMTFGLEFKGGFNRRDTNGSLMGNIYLLNGLIDWNWHERLGLGIQLHNMLYFQQYQLMQGYDEAGFEFIIYMKIGF